MPVPHPYALQGSQPSLADMWNDFPSTPGTLAAPGQATAHHAHTPTQLSVQVPAPEPAPAEPRPAQADTRATHEEPVSWLLLKHLMQLALVASVLLLVTSGGGSPAMALGYAATGLMLMGIMAVSDRQRFADSGAPLLHVEFVEATPAQPAMPDTQLVQYAYAEALQAHGQVPEGPPPFVDVRPVFPHLSVT